MAEYQDSNYPEGAEVVDFDDSVVLTISNWKTPEEVEMLTAETWMS